MFKWLKALIEAQEKEVWLEWILAAKETIRTNRYLSLRYLHFKSMALEFAKDFYVEEDDQEVRDNAYQNYVKYTKRAAYYEKKLDERKSPETFKAFLLR